MKIARLFVLGSALTLFACGFTACEQQSIETLEALEASHHGPHGHGDDHGAGHGTGHGASPDTHGEKDAHGHAKDEAAPAATTDGHGH